MAAQQEVAPGIGCVIQFFLTTTRQGNRGAFLDRFDQTGSDDNDQFQLFLAVLHVAEKLPRIGKSPRKGIFLTAAAVWRDTSPLMM